MAGLCGSFAEQLRKAIYIIPNAMQMRDTEVL
jgi:hypothetical protein